MSKTIEALVIHEVYEESFCSLRVLYGIVRGAVKVGALVAIGLEHPPRYLQEPSQPHSSKVAKFRASSF